MTLETEQTARTAPPNVGSRLQLALNVTDLEAAIGFYSTLFQTEPHKLRPGYANFEVADPPLKLILFEGSHGGDLNHIGVEVRDTARVAAETRRLGEAGLETRIEDGVVCCHAEQDKVWVSDPDGLSWEVYAITDDQPATLELIELDNATACANGECCTPA